MKEGYLQIKIRELDYKLKQQLELSENLERQLQLIINSKKEYKVIFNKLKNLDKFKDQIRKEIIMENKVEIKSVINESNEIINNYIHDAVENSYKKLKKYVDREIEQIKNRITDKNLVLQNSDNTLLNQNLSYLLMEELIKERILSNDRVEILKKRASIRLKKQEK